MKRIAIVLFCLALPSAAGDDVGELVDRLFSKDATERAAARKALLDRGDEALAGVLKRIEARQPAAAVVHMYAIEDLRADEKWWKLALARVRQAARGAERFQLHNQDQTLVVVAPEETQRRVAAELAELRRTFGRFVQLRVRVVELAAGAGALPRELAAADVDAFLEKRRGAVQTAPRLVCRDGQKANVAIVNQVSYVSDFDIEVQQDAFVVDPVVSILQEGVTLDLRPVAARDGGVSLVVEAVVSKLERPLATVALPSPSGQELKIQVPERRATTLTRLVACRPGKVALLDLGGGTVILVEAAPVDLSGDSD